MAFKSKRTAAIDPRMFPIIIPIIFIVEQGIAMRWRRRLQFAYMFPVLWANA